MWWIPVAMGIILVMGTAFLYWKTRADITTRFEEQAEQRGEKIEALEEALQDERQDDHEDDVREAKEVLDSGDRDRAIGFLVGSVRKARSGGGSGPGV